MKSNDYVKYITETVVKYIDQPKDVRKRTRLERKDQKEPFLYRWFGLIPYILYYSLKRKKESKFEKKPFKL
ncbi:YqzE family protein [Bacillus sp. S/N-304-OC-R1]|uniref:YqzE family protein n=1 Tax=Bacillus sp. S/N-304-OC-R1 TaxID=2758034 RepID=UPI001C8E7702|nr:YqzE family protein [Bacillus sp. S/N-304-OC-R1]MBY0122410.1 YqzE family protein [Bacillus sp. S/N-304-OC-R1]